MDLSDSLLRWLAGGLLFFGLAFFVVLYSANSSGVISQQYFNTIVTQMENSSSAQGTSGANSTQASSILSTFQKDNPNCNILCFADVQLFTQTTNLNTPLSTSNSSTYQTISEIVAVIGAILMFFAYKGSDKLFAAGRNLLSVGILTFVAVYLPLAFIFPALLSTVTIHSISFSMPSGTAIPFLNILLSLDLLFGTVGIGLMILKYIVDVRKKSEPKLI